MPAFFPKAILLLALLAGTTACQDRLLPAPDRSGFPLPFIAGAPS